MDLFKAQPLKTDPDQTERIKTWVYEALAISTDVPISISQLTCHEPNCPPIETVIAVMTSSPQQYKLHQAVGEITRTDIRSLG